MPQTKTPARGFGPLPCLKCGEDAAITLRLDAMDEEDAFTCAECNGTYSANDVAVVVGKWRRVLAWIESAPAQE